MVLRSATLRMRFLAVAIFLCFCFLPAIAHAMSFTLQSTIFFNNVATGVKGRIDPVSNTSGTVGTTAGTVLLSGSSLNLVGQDVFVFDLTLDAGSTAVDFIRVAVGSSDPLTNPRGAGIWSPDLVHPGEVPTNISVSLVTLAAQFDYGLDVVNSTNLNAGETTVRLFVTYQKATGGAGTLHIGNTASFTLSPAGSPTSFSVSGTIVPEPATLLLLGAGLAALGLRSKFGRGKAA